MSEKRFVYHEEYFPLNVREIIDNKIGKTYDCEDATDVLNELFNENEQLKEENEKLIQKKCLPCELVNLQTREIDKLKEENEQLRKIGVMYQGHNPCEICTYSLENKVCCAESIPISCDDAKKNFVQGLCKNHKQFQKSFRRYDDE